MNTTVRLIDDLSPNEVEVLTQPEIENFFRLACAEEGLPISEPDEPVAPPRLEPVPDLQLYQVGEYIFTTVEEADSVVKAISACRLVSVDYAHFVKDSYLKRATPHKVPVPNMESIKVFSTRLYEETTAAGIDKLKERHEQYKADHKEYERFVRARREMRYHVDEIVSNAARRKIARDRIRDQMREYEQLAEGNMDIAYRFLQKAHPRVEYDYPELFAGGWLRFKIADARDEKVDHV